MFDRGQGNNRYSELKTGLAQATSAGGVSANSDRGNISSLKAANDFSFDKNHGISTFEIPDASGSRVRYVINDPTNCLTSGDPLQLQNANQKAAMIEYSVGMDGKNTVHNITGNAGLAFSQIKDQNKWEIPEHVGRHDFTSTQNTEIAHVTERMQEQIRLRAAAGPSAPESLSTKGGTVVAAAGTQAGIVRRTSGLTM
jgi:hypothetical protein